MPWYCTLISKITHVLFLKSPGFTGKIFTALWTIVSPGWLFPHITWIIFPSQTANRTMLLFPLYPLKWEPELGGCWIITSFPLIAPMPWVKFHLASNLLAYVTHSLSRSELSKIHEKGFGTAHDLSLRWLKKLLDSKCRTNTQVNERTLQLLKSVKLWQVIRLALSYS